MKKKGIVLAIGVFMCLLFSACGSNNSENTAADTNQQESETENETNDSSNADAENVQDEGSESESVSTEPTEEEKTEEAAETIYNIGEGVPLKDWAIAVTNMQIVESIAADYGTFSPDTEGNKYAQVFVTVVNNGKQADTFLPSFSMRDDVTAKILYGDGYEFSSVNLLAYSNELHDSTLNPLSSKEGEIAFEIPESVANADDELLIQFSCGNDVIKFKLR